MTEARFPSLTLSGLSTGYRGRTVIRNLDLGPVSPGRITAIVGPNAAGKSTLLQAVAGLIPSSGALRLGALDLAAMPLARRAELLTFMPQILPQGIGLTVLESVITALKASPVEEQALPDGDAPSRAVAALERIGIADLALEQLDRLSGGQRQLAALAQAIVRNPKVLLLDEPTSALDLRHQIGVMKVARKIADEGKIVLIVLHDLSLAARWADEVVVIDHGQVIASGPPRTTLTSTLLRGVYGVQARIIEHSGLGCVAIVVEDTVADPFRQGP